MFRRFNAAGNQLDITRAFRARKYDSEAHDINLSLDRSVISHLEDISNTSFSDGFIRDDENTWQPAKLNYDSFRDVRASIKFTALLRPLCAALPVSGATLDRKYLVLTRNFAYQPVGPHST